VTAAVAVLMVGTAGVGVVAVQEAEKADREPRPSPAAVVPVAPAAAVGRDHTTTDRAKEPSPGRRRRVGESGGLSRLQQTL
jgi:hypothetical protein